MAGTQRKTTPLEYLQCLAFAHYAHSNGTDEQKETEWYSLFTPKDYKRPSPTKEALGKFMEYKRLALSSTFNQTIFSSILWQRYQSTLTENGNVTTSPYLKKVFIVAKTLASSSAVLSLSEYLFLDQTDPFTKKIKDECLVKISKTLGFRGNYDLLSPSDIFLVKSSRKDTILKDFESNILRATEEQIISNMAWGKAGKNTYRTISNRHFKEKSLIGISLKLPESIKAGGVIKIVGTLDVGDDLAKYLDPYTKLLAAMIAHPTKTTQLIDRVINIEFQNFKITPDLLSWEYPITFRYSEVMTPGSNEKLHSKNLRLKLFTWSAAGFNAQWYPGQDAPGNWTGGAGISPIESLFIRYSEYKGILRELVKIREDSFFYTIHGRTSTPRNTLETDIRGDFDKALRQVKKDSILTKGDSNEITNFFSKLPNGSRLEMMYMSEVIKRSTAKMGRSQGPIQDPTRTYSHYIASQCAWFLFRGGSNMHSYLKKRMFLSLFGIITKSAYQIFNASNQSDTILEGYVRKQITTNAGNKIASFSAAPYIILS